MPRRYAPDGTPLFYGKLPEDFSPEDTLRFMADTEALLRGKDDLTMAKDRHDENIEQGAYYLHDAPISDLADYAGVSIDEAVKMRVAAAVANTPPAMEVTARPIEPRGNLLGFASVKIGPLTVDDFKIVESKEGDLFVGPPSKPDKGSKTGYRNTVWIDKDSRDDFSEQVLGAYHSAVEQAQSKAAHMRSAPENEGIAAQMKAAQKQADRDNAARPAPAKTGKQAER